MQPEISMAQTKRISFNAIGTLWEIDVPTSLTSVKRAKIEVGILKLAEDYDKTYSRFRSDSSIFELQTKAGSVKLPDNAEELLTFYSALYAATKGKVTPLIGDALVDAGYDASYSLKPRSVRRKTKKWQDTIDYRHPDLHLKQAATLDFGAAGKGHLVDLIADYLRSQKINDFLIDGGGDMAHGTALDAEFRVGLEHPRDPSQVVGVALIRNQSICCSADNRRRWADMHHIIDPDSLRPTTEIISVWTVADNTMHADGLATALFFVDGNTLQKAFDFEYFLIRSDLTFEQSKGFRAEIYK